MIGAGVHRVLLLLSGFLVAVASGCADFDILPSWFPFQDPVSDELPGVVAPSARIEQYRQFSGKAAHSGPEEKIRVAEQLASDIRTEKDPLIRLEMIRVLGEYPSSESDAILKAAMSDADTSVRVAACEAWGRRADSDAVAILAEAVRSDVDSDVRLAAAKALGATRNSAAVPILGEALGDQDPAMQYRAVLSLKQVTGKDLGNDVTRWQKFIQGEQPEPPASWAQRLQHIF